MKKSKFTCAILLAINLFANAANAANVLIVNGSTSSSEPGTTTNITNNLQAVCAGNTYTVSDLPPGNLSAYDQVWDLRFSGSSPLTPTDQTNYLAFLQSGKRMFVMGENSIFATRNDSILNFITSAGGGSLAFTTPLSTQTFNPALTIGTETTINYSAPGGVTSSGTGSYMTSSGSDGTTVFWGTGTLGNASSGSLAVVFDVNFMQAGRSTGEQQLLSNLCRQVATGGGSVASVPVFGPAALFGLVFIMGGAARFSLRRKSADRTPV
jgi:hypothetical protein